MRTIQKQGLIDNNLKSNQPMINKIYSQYQKLCNEYEIRKDDQWEKKTIQKIIQIEECPVLNKDQKYILGNQVQLNQYQKSKDLEKLMSASNQFYQCQLDWGFNDIKQKLTFDLRSDLNSYIRIHSEMIQRNCKKMQFKELNQNIIQFNKLDEKSNPTSRDIQNQVYNLMNTFCQRELVQELCFSSDVKLITNFKDEVLLYNFNLGTCKQSFNLINKFNPPYNRYVMEYHDMQTDYNKDMVGFDPLFSCIQNMPNYLIIPNRSQLLFMIEHDNLNSDDVLKDFNDDDDNIFENEFQQQTYQKSQTNQDESEAEFSSSSSEEEEEDQRQQQQQNDEDFGSEGEIGGVSRMELNKQKKIKPNPNDMQIENSDIFYGGNVDKTNELSNKQNIVVIPSQTPQLPQKAQESIITKEKPITNQQNMTTNSFQIQQQQQQQQSTPSSSNNPKKKQNRRI